MAKYEWCMVTLDDANDIVNRDHSPTLRGLGAVGTDQRRVLIREDLDGFKDEAPVLSGRLQRFEGSDKLAPKKYRDEVIMMGEPA